MVTINEVIQDETPENYIELFDLDLTPLGGPVLFFTANASDIAGPITWQTNLYFPAPIMVTGFEWKGTPSAPPKPSLNISNIDGFIIAQVIQFNDLIGARITRWRTFKRFLDGESDANPNAHLLPDRLVVEQKASHTNKQVTWVLASAMDRENMKLPLRQILKDQTTRNLFAPGVARTRNR